VKSIPAGTEPMMNSSVRICTSQTYPSIFIYCGYISSVATLMNGTTLHRCMDYFFTDFIKG
jgi:hypothetical protein